MSHGAPHPHANMLAQSKPKQQTGHPAVMSLQKEVSIALDTNASPDIRAASLSKLHAAMATHKISRPAVAVVLLPWFLSHWPYLVACLWDPNPQLPAAVAPLLGLVGGLVASSRAAAAAADAAPAAAADATSGSTTSTSPAGPAAPAATAPGAPPVPPPGLLFDWLLPLLTGKVPLPTGTPAPLSMQVLICKTLLYALQQLPSCNGQSAAGAGEKTTVAALSAKTEVAVTVPAASGVPAAGASQQQKPAALLTARVPAAAAQQLHGHAKAVLAAVQELLEAAATPPALLAPLLQVLLEVIRLDMTVVTGDVLRDLLDLLLGWSVEPVLQPKDRHLITAVLSACKPCWLAEPQLLQDVSSKLLADLQQQLPVPAVGQTTDNSLESPLKSSPAQQQTSEEQQQFVALLSCLVAVLHVAVNDPRLQTIVGDTVTLLLAAHAAYCSQSNAQGNYAACAAAADVAALMLTLSRSLAAACAADVATKFGVDSRPDQQPDAAADASGGQALLAAEVASEHSSSNAARRSLGMIVHLWEASLNTLQLQELTYDLAVTVLDNLHSTLRAAAAAAASAETSQQQVQADGNAAHQTQESGASKQGSLQETVDQMAHNVFTSTLGIRCSDTPHVQAAAAALYTTALAVTCGPGAVSTPYLLPTVLTEVTAVSSQLSRSIRLSDDDPNGSVVTQQPDTRGADHQGHSARHKQDRNPAAESDTPSSSGQQNKLAGCTEQHLVSALLFDLLLLEGWIASRSQQQQQQLSAPPGASTTVAASQHAAAVASRVTAAAPDIVQAVHTVLELLYGSKHRVPGSYGIGAEVLDQMYAVLEALVDIYQLAALSEESLQSGNTGEHADAFVQQLLQCLQLLLVEASIPHHIQCSAVSLLSKLVLGSVHAQPQQCSVVQPGVVVTQPLAQSTRTGSTGQVVLSHNSDHWQQVVILLTACTNSSDPSVRAAAVTAVAKLANELWRQTTHSTQHLQRVLPALLVVLAERCSDLDGQVAAAAQSAVAGLAMPLYLLDTVGQSQLTDSSSHGHMKATATGFVSGQSAQTAGVERPCNVQGSLVPSWVRTAALQPQQRVFKHMQLAQLFDLMFQASPVMLQRQQALAAAAMVSEASTVGSQLAQLKYRAQIDALCRLAQGLPALPHPVQGSNKPVSTTSSKGSSSYLDFDSLNSAAALKWLLTQEAARHCVNARLRTHLGNPVATFTALEKMLQTLLKQLQSDGSSAAAQRSWQQYTLQQLQAALPQQHQPAAAGQPHEGQEPQLLHAPVAGLVSRPPAAQAGSQPQDPGSTAAASARADSRPTIEQQRLESEAAAVALLDFMWALEVNVQAAAEGSLLRPEVGKSVMAFFAGNKKVCDEWFSRTREALLGLSAAAGALQHTLYHGMARLSELASSLRAMRAHLQAQQQQLQQQQHAAEKVQEQQHKAKQQPSGGREAAAAAAAAAITGLSGQQGQNIGTSMKRQGNLTKQQQSQTQQAEQMKLRDKQKGPTPAASSANGSTTSQPLAAAASQEKLQALQQQYQTSVIRLAGPILSSLVLLVDSLVCAGEGAAIIGLSHWAHESFSAVWQGINRLYALDLTTDIFVEADSKPTSTMLLLSWMSAAAVQADGRLEEALHLYHEFLQSPACSVPLGSALEGFITEQMAACYAAVADWQGLRSLGGRKSTKRPGSPLQSQPLSLHHWVFAGPAALSELQHWQPSVSGSSQHLQQNSRGQQQHIGHRGPAGGHRGSVASTAQADHGQLMSGPLNDQMQSLSAAQQVILRAMQSSRESSEVEPSRRQPQRGGGRGRGMQGGRHSQQQRQNPQPLLQQSASSTLADLQSELGSLCSNPLYVWSVLCDGPCTHACSGQAAGPASDKLQQLAIMQLLQEVLTEQHTQSAAVTGNELQHPSGIQAGIGAWLTSCDHAMLPKSGNKSISTDCNVWADALSADGELRPGHFNRLQSVMPVLQVVATTGERSAAESRAAAQIISEALLSCHEGGNNMALQRLLDLAVAHTSREPNGEQQQGKQLWLQLLKAKFLQHSRLPGGSSAVQEAVTAHMKVVQPFWPIVSDNSSVSQSSSASAVAAAYLSLSGLLASGAVAPAGDWEQLHQLSWQQVQGTAQRASALVKHVPAGQLPAVASCSAAIAAAPASPAAWKAYGDALYSIASSVSAGEPQATGAADGAEPSQPHHQQQLLLAACDAYGNYLAAAVNAHALTSPEQGLGVLLRLLQVAMEHGDALQAQLEQVFGHIPVSAWQVLTPQLLGQLQHGSAAVRTLVQQLLQGLAVVVPCAVLYPLVVEVRAAEEEGQQPPAELEAVISQLQSQQPRLLADTCAMAAAMSQLTVTPREAWAGLVSEMGVEVNRKLLALQADAARQSKQGVSVQRRKELLNSRYHTVMSPVLAGLQQHLTSATASAPVSPDEAAFREDMLPKLQGLLQQLRTPPAELMAVLEEPQDRSSSGEQRNAPAGADSKKEGAAAGTATKAGIAAGGWAPLKQLQQQLAQQLRQQHHLDLAAVAPLLASLRDTAIPLPADDLTATALPPLPLRDALFAESSQSGPLPGAMLAAAASTSTGDGSWLCIAGFDKTVLVLPTKTRPKRLRMLATDGSVHAFLLKGRDDLRVDERIMQFMRTANSLLATADTQSSGHSSSRLGCKLRVRPYSITPFGRRAGLVQWVRHTTSLFGLVRNWQTAAAERYKALAAAKREAAAAAAAAASTGSAATQSAAADGGKAAAGPPLAASANRVAAAGVPSASAATPPGPTAPAAATPPGGTRDDGSRDGIVLPLMVAAARPVDAYYARLLPALQAAGVPVGAPRSSWPADVLRNTFMSLQREAPRNLLAHQLLSSSAHPGSWWSSQQCFTASAAAGSMLGWLLGLGDRHLDNLLLVTDSGELLHIDFSVCFDKGASLAVPEVVPFRLTQMMQAALGPGGIAGGFSSAACAVLTVLQQSSELLAALLALLLSDPAVDWSVEREAHAAKKDQDTAVSLNLFASRIEELRPQLLSGLAAALPTIGNGLAAIVNYGEAHVYMHQLQTQAAAARAKAAAAQAALAEATAGEATALTQGADASRRVTDLTVDSRRLCGLASSCIGSAANWLGRHEQTLQTLMVVPTTAGSAGPQHSNLREVQCLVAVPAEWDPTACDRPLALLGSNTDSSASSGILQQALHPLIAVSSSSSTDMAMLLPAALHQQCLLVDVQGRQLMQQLARLVHTGRWATTAYAMVLQQLLSDSYIQQSHHWCWSHAFTAAVSGPHQANLITATAATPETPSALDASRTWATLAACWAACQLQQEHHAAASAAAAASVAAGLPEDRDVEQSYLRQQLRQLASQLGTMSEHDSARVQLVASKAMSTVCDQVGSTMQQLQQQLSGAGDPAGPQQLSACCTELQEKLACLQSVVLEYQQAELSYILDLSTSPTATGDLPEAAATLEDLLEQHADNDEQLQLALQQQQQGQQHKWIADSAGQLQLVLQLLSALQFEAMPPVAAWAAAAAMKPSEADGGLSSDEAVRPSLASVVMLQAGPVSQLQLWTAAQQTISNCWQRLEGQLQQAQQLEAQMQALAAVAAAGGAASIGPDDPALAAQVEMLQQQLMPQGYDVTYVDDCVAAAQLLQVQWGEAERSLVATLGSCLCPLLGLAPLGYEHWLNPEQGGGEAHSTSQLPVVDEQALGVLQQLLAAAAASVAGGAIMHSKDVFDALAGAGTSGPAGLGPSSSSIGGGAGAHWGTPGLSDAWKSFVVLLLQCGCAQQHLQQQQQGFEIAASEPAAAATWNVLQSSTPLPLDLDSYRPLVFVLQIIKQLTDTVSTDSSKQLWGQLQQLLLQALAPPLVQPLQQQLAHLQQHLQALASEAELVLSRQQQQHGYPTSRRVQSHHAPGQPSSASEMGLGPDLGDLVPFDAFDPSLPGADMVLEEGLGGLSDSPEGEQTSAVSSAADQGTGLLGGPTAAEHDEELLSGLDWLDEEALQQGQQDDGSSIQAGERGESPALDLPELVPFDAFDPALPGAGAALEDESMLGGWDNSLEGGLEDAHQPEDGDAANASGKQQQQQAHTGADHTDCAAEVKALGQLCLSVGSKAARQLLQQQQLAGLQQAAATCAWQQQVWLRHLAASEWVWGDLMQQQTEADRRAVQKLVGLLLQATTAAAGIVEDDRNYNRSAAAGLAAAAAGGTLQLGAAYRHHFEQLGLLQLLPQHPGAAGDSSGVNMTMPSRQELVAAWQEVSEACPAVEAGLADWQAAAAACVQAVRDVLVVAAAEGQQIGDPAICLKVLSGLSTRSQSWCSSAVGILESLAQLGEAALQLEYSRRGTLWAPGVDAGVDAFQGNFALLAQLQTAISALIDAEAAVTAATSLLTSSQLAEQQAEATLDEAAAEQAAAEHELGLRTPAALARVQGLTGVLKPMLDAADSALGSVTEGLGSMMKALTTLVERNTAARDLGPIAGETVAQHNRCVAVLTRLRDIGAAAAAGLQEALFQQQQLLTGDEIQDQHVLLHLVLTHMQPALHGLQEELHELGQAHILFTQLTHQLDSLAAAAQTVSAAITAEHAVQTPAADASLHTAGSPWASGSTVRKQRAEARRRAFAAAAMQRCSARLTGSSSSRSKEAGEGLASTGSAASVSSQVTELIEAATDVDKLCRMYEGWTPWL